jgi:hypothetical protein
LPSRSDHRDTHQLDRDNPEPKDFGKLVWRGGLNFFANSPYFGGFSALAIDPSGKTILAISDAGIWLRGTIDYDKRKMKGLSNGRDRPAAWH